MGRKIKQNSITSPELLAQVCEQNKQLQTDFLGYLKSVQRAQTTIQSYDGDLKIFFCWNLQHNNNKPFVKVTKREIARYQSWLLENNENSSARVRRLKSTLSSLSNYIENILDEEEEYKDFRPIVNKIENPVNTPKHEKTVLSEEQLYQLLDILVEQGKYQIACAVALGAFSGRRKSELAIFKENYFDKNNLLFDGALYRTPEKIKTKGRGTGKFLYCWTIRQLFEPYLKLWLEERKEKGVDSEWLFVMKKKGVWEAIKPDTFNSWAITCSDILEVNFYFHSLRHFYVTYLVKQGIPDDVIQEVLGWTSREMIAIYSDLDTTSEFGKYFTADGIVNAESKTLTDLVGD